MSSHHTHRVKRTHEYHCTAISTLEVIYPQNVRACDISPCSQLNLFNSKPVVLGQHKQARLTDYLTKQLFWTYSYQWFLPSANHTLILPTTNFIRKITFALGQFKENLLCACVWISQIKTKSSQDCQYFMYNAT